MEAKRPVTSPQKARRHGEDDGSMSMSSGMMGMMSMGGGSVDPAWIPQVYWIFVGAVIAALALAQFSNYLLYRQRLRAFLHKTPDPARPQSMISGWIAMVTALYREVANLSMPILSPKHSILGWTSQSPSLGSCFLLVANTVLLLVLGFYQLDPTNHDNYESIAYRWGYLTLGQFPLIFLLAGKENIIGCFTGHSYERLNWLHRWVARCMLLTATLHMGFWFGDWAPYDYIGYQVQNDKTFTQTGLAAWCILLWLVLSTVAPIRGLSYEIFFLQHFISFVAFTAMVFIHTPLPKDHAWLWVPVALFFFDRLLRWIWLAHINLAIFHSNSNAGKSLLACHAEISPLPGRMTRVTIHDPPVRWRPGQHIHLSAQSINPLQTHPFTIASLPSDGKIEFIVKAHRGGTRRFFDVAEKHLDLPTTSKPASKTTIPCMISDPYGSMRPLRQFDSVVLFAGSTGATFTVPLLRDIVRQWKTWKSRYSESKRWLGEPDVAVVRRIRFVWIVKSGEHIIWFAEQLRHALLDVKELRNGGLDVRLQVSVYVTCDEAFTADWGAIHPSRPKIMQEKSAVVEDYGSSSSAGATPLNEKKVSAKDDQQEVVREIDPRSGSTSSDSGTSASTPKACRPDGTCCCQATVTDERWAPSFACKCNCAVHEASTFEDIDTKPVAMTSDPVRALAQQEVAVISGRPHLKIITRRSLEQARGESAVVVCGPQGLNNDVRRTIVELSDERAFARATGALGVWFWAEGFGW